MQLSNFWRCAVLLLVLLILKYIYYLILIDFTYRKHNLYGGHLLLSKSYFNSISSVLLKCNFWVLFF